MSGSDTDAPPPRNLPIETVLPELLAALERQGRAVLQAPPGAGKTTRVPLALLPAVEGRIVMLEPRRIAARAAAERMAATLGEPVGGTIGYRIRGEARTGPVTRVEVVTEGILTRMLQSDPALDGVGALIFDEFHERSVHADLGLALAWEARGALRPDLLLLVMSATLDAEPVAAMLDGAPVVTAAGRAYPVETIWLPCPLRKERRLEDGVADIVAQGLAEREGDVLAFLPGEAEIRRVAARLDGAPAEIRPLYGALPPSAQRAALAPGAGRKVVLATAIAETSLTIPGVRVVVDAGRARRARYDPGSGMSRLVTERVTRAEADQRRGRAGRETPGTCYRMWTRGEEGALALFPPPEIETADLAGLALELAAWGARAAEGLAFLTPPPPGALAEAQGLLTDLGAIDGQGAITPHGRALVALPLHPRLGHMLALAGPAAAPLAALLSERDPLRGAPADLRLRMAALAGATDWPADSATLARIRAEARRLARRASSQITKDGSSKGSPPPQDGGTRSGDGETADRPAGADLGTLAALAYPDRIGLRRPGDAPRWLLSGGKGAAMDPGDPLAAERLLAVTDTDGDPREGRIRQALPIAEAELRRIFADRIRLVRSCVWSRRDGAVRARVEERLGAVALSSNAWSDAPPDAVAQAMLEGARELGLPWSDPARRFRARVELARAGGEALPPMDDEALLATAEDWLLPFLAGVRTAAAWRKFDLLPALRAMLPPGAETRLDRLAPARFVTPAGRSVAIDYDAGAPTVAAKLQEMFGVTEHPRAAGQPLIVTLLSPAGRPLAVTADLPGFWTGAYADVRREMRGRYPKHPWPEDPRSAPPTLRAKPRG